MQSSLTSWECRPNPAAREHITAQEQRFRTREQALKQEAERARQAAKAGYSVQVQPPHQAWNMSLSGAHGLLSSDTLVCSLIGAGRGEMGLGAVCVCVCVCVWVGGWVGGCCKHAVQA